MASVERRISIFVSTCALAAAFSASLFAQAAPQKHPSWLPRISCAEAWKNVAHQYDYRTDAQAGALGNEGYAAYAARVNRKLCYKPWTVLVYMAADNELTPYAFMDLYEMEAGFVAAGGPKVGSTLRSDLVVQLDTRQSHKVRRLHMFQTPEAYDRNIQESDFAHTAERDVRSPIVLSYDETAARTPKADLESFLKWGVREYPAEQYMVIVWGHGQGWTSATPLAADRVQSRFAEFSDVNAAAALVPPTLPVLPTPLAPTVPAAEIFAGRGFGGLAFDESEHTFLAIPDLNAALASVRRELQGNRIDVYASDACLMQMFEVAHELSRNTRYVVGSTQVQNFLGLPYRRLMTELNTGYFAQKTKASADSDEAFLLAGMIPKVFKASMQPNGLQGRLNRAGIKTVTMSTLNSAELRGLLAPRLRRLAVDLRDYIREDELRAVDLQFAMQNAPAFAGGAQDLGGFLTLVSTLVSAESRAKASLTPAAERLQSSLGLAHDAVLRSVNAFALGTNYSTKTEQLYLLGLRGLSVWLPTTAEDYHRRQADFAKSSFYRSGTPEQHWALWLDEIYK